MSAVYSRRLLTIARPSVFRALPSSATYSATGTPLRPSLINNRVTATTTAVRKMTSSTEPQKYEWLVILPDQQGALPRRMEVRGYVFTSSSFPPHPHSSTTNWQRPFFLLRLGTPKSKSLPIL